MWKYGVALIVVLFIVLIFISTGIFSSSSTPTVQCVPNDGVGLKAPKWKDDKWVCPDDYTSVNTCSSDDDCQQGYRCDEVCRINCTNSEGTLDSLAVTNCSNGYYSEPWTEARYAETDTLSLPHMKDNKILQVKNSHYGNKDRGCDSAGSNKLTEDAAAGADLYIGNRGYNTYFGGDPCFGTTKFTTFDYRYV